MNDHLRQGFNVIAQVSPWRRQVEMLFILKDQDRNIAYAKPLTVERPDDNSLSYSEPTVRLDMEAAQDLIDALWRCGLRPTEGHGSAGQLAATERHLADIRKIAFKKLGVE